MSSRTFPNTTTEQVYKTAEKVLRLSDPNDVTFSHSENKMVGSRKINVFAVLAAITGRYDFIITAHQDSKTVVVKLDVSSEMQNFLGPVVRGEWPYRETYDAYFGRMEALLYGKPWRICEELGKIAESDTTLEPLCIFADDNIPVGIKLSEQSAQIIVNKKAE